MARILPTPRAFWLERADESGVNWTLLFVPRRRQENLGLPRLSWENPAA
jgi:hypothetical protein